MASSLVKLLLVLVVTSLYSCHASRVLNGCILDNVGLTASDPSLNGIAISLPAGEAGSKKLVSLPENGSRLDAYGGDVTTNKGKYKTLVLNVLPKGTTKPGSGPSKRHNDFNS